MAAGALALAVSLLVLVSVLSRPETDDNFGVRKIQPDAKDGMVWEADWSDSELSWPEDPWVEIGSRTARYRSLDGVLHVSGQTSRIYIRDPELQRQWTDVEVTVYAKRIADDSIPYSGIVSAVRANHGVTADLSDAPCDSRNLTARLRFDGMADFGKETSHPVTISTDPVKVFENGMPYGEWIGYKHIVYDLPNHSGTHQELWIDLTDGKDGGTWELVATHDDTLYSDFGEEPCAAGVDPTIPYINGPRAGSESGLPSISVFFRADGIRSDGLLYKWASVREIKKTTIKIPEMYGEYNG